MGRRRREERAEVDDRLAALKVDVVHAYERMAGARARANEEAVSYQKENVEEKGGKKEKMSYSYSDSDSDDDDDDYDDYAPSTVANQIFPPPSPDSPAAAGEGEGGGSSIARLEAALAQLRTEQHVNALASRLLDR